MMDTLRRERLVDELVEAYVACHDYSSSRFDRANSWPVCSQICDEPSPDAKSHAWKLDGLEIDLAARAVRRDGELVHLTPIDALCGRATATAGAQARVGSNTGLDPRVARHLLLASSEARRAVGPPCAVPSTSESCYFMKVGHVQGGAPDGCRAPQILGAGAFPCRRPDQLCAVGRAAGRGARRGAVTGCARGDEQMRSHAGVETCFRSRAGVRPTTSWLVVSDLSSVRQPPSPLLRGRFDQPAGAQPRSPLSGGDGRRVLAAVADLASARWLAPDLFDPGQADRVAGGVRGFRGGCRAKSFRPARLTQINLAGRNPPFVRQPQPGAEASRRCVSGPNASPLERTGATVGNLPGGERSCTGRVLRSRQHSTGMHL